MPPKVEWNSLCSPVFRGLLDIINILQAISKQFMLGARGSPQTLTLGRSNGNVAGMQVPGVLGIATNHNQPPSPPCAKLLLDRTSQERSSIRQPGLQELEEAHRAAAWTSVTVGHVEPNKQPESHVS